jgi:hypothetical protein
VRGLARPCPTEVCLSVVGGTVCTATVVLLPRGPFSPGTPATHFSWQGATGVCSRTGRRNRKGGSRPCIPWLKPRGFLAHSL